MPILSGSQLTAAALPQNTDRDPLSTYLGVIDKPVNAILEQKENNGKDDQQEQQAIGFR